LKSNDPLAANIVGIFDQRGQFLCTGTIIREDIVLTAAHCVVSKASQIKIIFGVDAFGTLNARELDVQKEFIRRVVSARAHEKYERDETKQPQADQNDIALLKFAGPLPAGFKPALMVEKKEDLTIGAMATVAGYGVNKVDVEPVDAQKMSHKKLEAGLEDGSIACNDDSMKECFLVDMTGDGFLRAAQAKIKILTESEVRLDESKGQGTCSGDSGGPAFLEKDGAYYLFGVTSRGNLLCNEEGVYTSAVAHAEWISKTIPLLH
jgi:secreted trypsin-like serine protease